MPTVTDYNRNVSGKPEDRLVHFISENGKINLSTVYKGLRSVGLSPEDNRLQDSISKLKKASQTAIILDDDVLLEPEVFKKCISENVELFVKAFTADLVIPEFEPFCQEIKDIYNLCKNNYGGKVADYIPQLSRYSPDNWGLSVCTVDGQRFSAGCSDVGLTIQGAGNVVLYTVLCGCIGIDKVHEFVGQESQSSTDSYSIQLNKNNKPHNPMINTGAIVCASLLKNTDRPADRFEYAMSMYRRLAGGERVGFNNSVFLSERATADRNFALGHYLKENGCFPEGLSLQETMDLYFQLCSVEVTCESASVIAATFANGGYCPTTGDNVVEGDAVRNTLSLMHSCGMYDYSGQFAFNVGLPAKSGVSGIVLLVIPNMCGICLWSPPLDEYGNSVRGIQFCEELVRRFSFHEYEKLKSAATKKFDPRVKKTDEQGTQVTTLHFGASNGDITALRRMYMEGHDLGIGDYDGRTALHLAAAEGHLECVQFLVEQGKVDPSPKDRFGQTPMQDAEQFKRTEIVNYMKTFTKE